MALATASSTAEDTPAAAALDSRNQVEVASSVAVGSLVVATLPVEGTLAAVASFVVAGSQAEEDNLALPDQGLASALEYLVALPKLQQDATRTSCESYPHSCLRTGFATSHRDHH